MTWSVHTAPSAPPISLAEAKAHLRAGDDEDALITAIVDAARLHVERVCERALMAQKWRVSLDAFPHGGLGAIEIPGGLVRAVDEIKYFDAAQYTGTYSRSGTTVTVTLAGHTYVAGDSVDVVTAADPLLAGGQTVASAADANTFTFTDLDAAGASSGGITVLGRRQALYGYQLDLERQPARILPPASGCFPATQSGRANAVSIVASVGYAKASEVPPPLKAALLLIAGDLYANREASIVGMNYVETPVVAALLMPWRRVIP